ncbi:MAG: carbohydrate-binding domain-containing protein [Bacteroidales bacterium]|nr:carbohydrate-binding domain-containing protein [Bacteroidales bacterium]
MKYFLTYILFVIASIQVFGQIVITNNDTLTIENDTVVFNVSSFKGSAQWQYSTDAVLWTDITGANSAIYKINAKGNEGYYRAKISYSYCVPAYSEIAQIKTIPSVVTTLEVTNLTENTATFAGSITNTDSEINIIARGFFLSTTNTLPDSKDMVIISGSGIGSFSKTYTNLTPETKYYLRAFALENNITVYGNVISFTTPTEFIAAPIITTNKASEITETTATISASLLTVTQNTIINSKGFYWTTNSNDPGDREYTINAGEGNGDFSTQITSLPQGTTVYYRAFAYYQGGEVLGSILSFTTKTVVNPPIVTTVDAVDISTNTVTIKGNVSADETAEVQAYGFYWSASNSTPNYSDNNLVMGSGTGAFSKILRSLSPATTYYFRAYASYKNGTVLGDVLSFTTTKEVEQAPLVSTIAATGIDQTTATLNGNISTDGKTIILVRGFYWSSTNENPTKNDNYIILEGETGNFSKIISSLTPNTRYYFKAYATYSNGTVTGNVFTFKTAEVISEIPTINTVAVENVTENSAELIGNVYVSGNVTIASRGFYWSKTNQNPDVNDNIVLSGTGTGSFSSVLSLLETGTQYYFKAFAIYDNETVTGSVLSFTTLNKTTIPPTVETLLPTNITENSTTLNATVLPGENITIATNGFYISAENSNPNENDRVINLSAATGDIKTQLSDLLPNTVYYVKAFSLYQGGEVTGEIVQFKTAEHIIPTPVVTTLTATEVNTYSATINANIVSVEAQIELCGFYWSVSNNDPTVNDSNISIAGKTGDIAQLLQNLNPSTTYYFRAFATYSGKTVLGETVSFTTKEKTTTPPTVTTLDVEGITHNAAIVNALVNNLENISIDSVGFYLSTSNSNPSSSDSIISLKYTTSTIEYALQNLIPLTSYYIKAFIRYSEGTVTGNVVSFTTSAAPVVLPKIVTLAATDITTNSATLNGVLTIAGNLPILSSGFYWSYSNADPTEHDSIIYQTITANQLTANLADLSAETTYYFKAFVETSEGTITGNVVVFTTEQEPIIAPTIITEAATALTQNSADLNGSITDLGNSDILGYGFYWSATNTNPTGSDNTISLTYANNSFTKTINGLSPETTYYFRSYVIYTEGIILGNVLSFTTEAAPVIPPVINTLLITNISETSAKLNAEITSDQTEVISRGFYWSQTNSNPTATDNIITVGNGAGVYSFVLNGLLPATTYYVVAFAQYSEGTILSSAQTFTTQVSIKDLYIELDGSSISTNSTTAIIDGSTIIVTSGGNYAVTGSLTDGQIIVNSIDTTHVTLTLNEVDINNSTSSGIYISSAIKTNIVLGEGTTNYITDGENYIYTTPDQTEPNAAIFSKDDLEISGTGKLIIDANYKNGIVSNDKLSITSGTIEITATDDALIGKDNVEISGGDITVKANGDGIKSSKKADATLGYVSITGGTISIEADGDGIDAETSVFISNASIDITTGGGSNATITDTLSHKGIKANSSITIESGTLNINAAGDAINSDSVVLINGGTIKLTTGAEGISANADITINNGNTTIISDNNSLYSDTQIAITGGKLTVTSQKDVLNTAGLIAIYDGTLNLTTQDEGMNADSTILVANGDITIVSDFVAIKAGDKISLLNGTYKLTVGGGCSEIYNDTLARHGIESNNNIVISAGVYTISVAGDGINSKDDVLINGGTFDICAGDEGVNGNDLVAITAGELTINSVDDAIASSVNISISGGKVTANNSVSSGNATTAGILNISDGTVNITITKDDSKAIKSSGTMTLSGGVITVKASGNATLVSTGSGSEPSYCTAIKSDADIIVSGSDITITHSGMGGRGISTDATILISGGTVKITTTGNGGTFTNSANAKDAYGAICINADGNITISNGSVTLSSSGSGGKGISSDGTITIGQGNESPTLNVTTTGAKITVSTTGSGFGSSTDYYLPKAIKGATAVVVNNGTITIKSTDDGIKSDNSITINNGTLTIENSVEGLEAKFITVNGGFTSVTSSNDGINATAGLVSGGDNGNDGSLLKVTGGVVIADGLDAVDSNGSIEQTGGTIITHQLEGLTGPEEAFDFNGSYLMNGGYSFGAGGNSFMIQAMSPNSTQNNLFLTTTTLVTANSFFRIQDSNGKDIITVKLPYGGYKFLFSSNQLTNGTTYNLYTGGSYSGGTITNGIYSGGTYSGGSMKKSFTVSGRVTNVTF